MINNVRPTVLVYRRTHKGDPDKRGVFGCRDCMGSVRAWDYDAVIGIGGVRPWPGFEKISRKVNWVGIKPKRDQKNSNEPLVTFEKFVLLDDKGPLLSECAPKLYKYMFEQGRIPRTGKIFPDDIYEEILHLLKLADSASPSQGCLENFKSKSTCKTRQQSDNPSRKCG